MNFDVTHAAWRLVSTVALTVLLSMPAFAYSARVGHELADLLTQRIDQVDTILASPDGLVSVRDVSNAALASLALGQNPQVAERLLNAVFAVQDPQTGRLPWLLRGGIVPDDNAIEFGTQAWGPILIGYGDKLSPEFRRAMYAHALLGARALNRPVKVGYTNIYLMNSVNYLLIGQATGDVGLLNRGRAQLRQWIEATRRDGLREFNSPTYYAADLNSLVTGFRYASAQQDRELFADILKFFWADISASVVNGKLVGGNSRKYDVLRGVGALNSYLAAYTCPDCAVQLDQIAELVYPYLDSQPGGYRVDPVILALSHLSPRTMQARFADAPNAVRSLFVDGNAAIGAVAVGNLSSTDNPFAIDLVPETGGAVTVSFVSSGDDRAFGERVLDAESGRRKWHHEPLNPGLAQRGGWVLGTFDVPNPNRPGKPSLPGKPQMPGVMPDGPVEPNAPHPGEFTTSLIFPAATTETRINGVPLQARTLSNSPPETLFVRAAGACAGIRILHVDSQGVGRWEPGRPPAGEGANRLVWQHDDAAPSARIAFLARAGQCGDQPAESWMSPLMEAHVTQSRSGNEWNVSVDSGPAKGLGVVRDLQRHDVRAIVGTPQLPPSSVLMINGTDYTGLLPRLD